MTRRMYACIIAVCISLTMLLPSTSKAQNYSFGPVLWYAWWNPLFENYLKGKDMFLNYGSKSKFQNSSLLYGPSFSYRISDAWSMSMVFMFCAHNQYRASAMYWGLESLPVLMILRVKMNKISRYDFDWTFSYSITNIVKFFIGAKAQMYTYEGRFQAGLRIPPRQVFGIPPRTFPLKDKVSALMYNLGPGIGFSFNFSLGKGFFILWNISGICLAGEMNLEKPSGRGSGGGSENVFINYGGNTNLSLAYHFASSGVTIAVGGRYQITRFYTVSYKNYEHDPNTAPSLTDQFYGATLSVIASF